jgi:acyl carrier protein
MTRHDILQVIIKHLALNSDVDPGAVDPGKSMADHGASSLDIVEVVGASMRELGVSIPRTELANLRNIDALVDLLARHKKV